MSQKLFAAANSIQPALASANARQFSTAAAAERLDTLTQVSNRRTFDQELQEAHQQLAETGKPCQVILLSIQNFSKLIESHGKDSGDEVLRQEARALRHVSIDKMRLARYDGTTFGLLLTGSSRVESCQFAEKLRTIMATLPLRNIRKGWAPSVCGAIVDLQPGEEIASLCTRAEAALAASLNAGGNCSHWHDGRHTHRIASAAPPQRPGTAASSGSDGVGAMLGKDWINPRFAEFDNLQMDPVADVSSRSIFLDDMMRRMGHWQEERGAAPLSLLLIQIDAYASFVRDGGRAAAETLIRIVGKVLKASLREMDHVARLSDETFAILLPGANLSSAAQTAERFRKRAQHCRLPASLKRASFTVTLGVVEVTAQDDLQRVLDRAKIALTTAINRGRNCIHAADSKVGNLRKLIHSQRP